MRMDECLMNIEDHVLLWNSASVKVLDIRYRVMEIGEILCSYQTPSSVFIVITRGEAQV